MGKSKQTYNFYSFWSRSDILISFTEPAQFNVCVCIPSLANIKADLELNTVMMDGVKFLSSTCRFILWVLYVTTCKRKCNFDRPVLLEGESYKGFEVYNLEFPSNNNKVTVCICKIHP